MDGDVVLQAAVGEGIGMPPAKREAAAATAVDPAVGTAGEGAAAAWPRPPSGPGAAARGAMGAEEALEALNASAGLVRAKVRLPIQEDVRWALERIGGDLGAPPDAREGLLRAARTAAAHAAARPALDAGRPLRPAARAAVAAAEAALELVAALRRRAPLGPPLRRTRAAAGEGSGLSRNDDRLTLEALCDYAGATVRL